MKRLLLPVCLLAAVMAARAQQQEEGLLQRIDAARPDSNKVSAFQDKSYASSVFSTKAFGAAAFNGVKGAPLKTFETRSFLGIKNPWFGKKVFGTYASSEAARSAKEAQKQFETEAFAVRENDKGGKKDLVDANATLPSAAQPRPYIVPPKAPGVMDRFTENLHKDLSIDDVRDLLNKGHAE